METSNAVASIFRFADDCETVTAGTTVFQQGDPGDCMYVVRTGQIEIRVSGKTILEVGPGDVFGELALIDAGARSASATATADSTLVRVDARKFEFLIQQHPFFALAVMKLMAERIRHMNDLVGPT